MKFLEKIEKQKIMNKNGKFVISLDFELLWGMRDKRTIDTYGENILGVRNSIPKMIELFNEFSINATFATVGFLFAKNKNEVLEYSPTIKIYHHTMGILIKLGIMKLMINTILL